MFHDGPIRVIGADGGIDLEPAGELDEELDVFPLVELGREFPLYLGIVNDLFIQGAIDLKG